jgi:hypothetical protein
MKFYKVFIPVVAVMGTVLFGVSCSTKVELNADYKPMTIVFGLMDPDQDTQFVKINKTWLGDGDNLVYALDRDSSEYPTGAFMGTVTRYNDGQPTNDVYPIEEIILENKDEGGIFFSPTYKAYYFVTSGGVNTSSTYQLDLDFADKDDVTASTTIVDPVQNNGNITQPPVDVDAYNFQLVTPNSSGNITFNDFKAKWQASENAKRYEVYLDFHYREYRFEDDAHTIPVDDGTPKVLSWFLGSENASYTYEELEKKINWKQFFELCAQRIPVDSKVIRRIGTYDGSHHDVFDFILVVANDELSTFMDVNSPVTGIIQERPEYTNIGNGLGLFASRLEQRLEGLAISSSSVTALVESEITASLGFCSPIPGSDLNCFD